MAGDAPLPFQAELFTNRWIDVTNDAVRKDSGMHVTITRGRQDEDSQVVAGRCTLALEDSTGDYAPRNPTGRLFGLIGGNTPFRFSYCGGATYLYTEHQSKTVAAHGAASTPDAAALDITGDIDIRINTRIYTWTSAAYNLAHKWESTGSQRSWTLSIKSDGKLSLIWSTGGTLATVKSAESTIGADWWSYTHFRATLDVNNGASGHTVTFYTSADGSTWTQLGDAVTGSGTTSIFASTAELRVGGRASGTTNEGFRGEIRSAELRTGIGGSVVANPDFTAQTDGATSFSDGTGKTWTVNTGKDAELTHRRVRFAGEVSEWPQRWEAGAEDTTDAWTPLQAAGVLRRLGRGRAPLKSAFYRELTAPSRPTPVAYWPCEDGSGAQAFGSAVGGDALNINVGEARLASYDGFACSSPLPTVGDAQLLGHIGPYSETGRTILRCLVHVPSPSPPGKELIAVRTTGSANLWRVFYEGNGGDLSLRAYDADTNQIMTTGPLSFDIDDTNIELNIDLTEVGNNVEWDIGVRYLADDGTSTALANGGTLNNRSVGRAIRVAANWDRALTEASLGHIVVSNTEAVFTGIQRALESHHGEAAGDRLARLCAEEGVRFRCLGNQADTAPMGFQRIGTLIDLSRACEDADAGVLYETRDEDGLTYRPRHALTNQAPRLALDYTDRRLSPGLEPLGDDFERINDLTVEREGGASARVIQEEGRLSVHAPPTGVGRYEDRITLSLARDDQVLDHAGWRVHVSTWDEDRYPVLPISPALNNDITDTIAEVEIGDLTRLASPPAPIPPDDLDLLAHGYTESIDGVSWDLVFVAGPAGPYRVAVLEDDVLGRCDTDGSEIAAEPTTATAAGDANALNYIVVPDVQAAGFSVGNKVQLFDSTGALKEGGHFTVTSKDSAFGFTNIFFTPNARETTATNDLVRRADETSLSVRRSGEVMEDFEDSDFAVAITYGGNAVWARSSAQQHGGFWSFKSGTIGNSETSDAIVQVPAGATSLSFWYLISSETGFDFGDVLLDGIRQLHVSGLGSWTQVTYDVSSIGEVTFRYTKDSNLAANDDAFYIDDLMFTTDATTPLWTTDAAEFPFDINVGGERITVGGISGLTSPQTFSPVTRAVNGVVKAHGEGTDVRLWTPMILDL